MFDEFLCVFLSKNLYVTILSNRSTNIYAKNEKILTFFAKKASIFSSLFVFAFHIYQFRLRSASIQYAHRIPMSGR